MVKYCDECFWNDKERCFFVKSFKGGRISSPNRETHEFILKYATAKKDNKTNNCEWFLEKEETIRQVLKRRKRLRLETPFHDFTIDSLWHFGIREINWVRIGMGLNEIPEKAAWDLQGCSGKIQPQRGLFSWGGEGEFDYKKATK